MNNLRQDLFTFFTVLLLFTTLRIFKFIQCLYAFFIKTSKILMRLNVFFWRFTVLECFYYVLIFYEKFVPGNTEIYFWYLVRKYTHYLISENIAFSVKAFLILLMSAFFCKKSEFFGKNGTFTQINSVRAVLKIF